MTVLTDYLAHRFDHVERGPSDMHDYQNLGVEFAYDNPFSAFFVDLGLGKSIMMLTLILRLITRHEASHVLVIAPVRVAAETWPTEIGLWSHTCPLSFVHVRHEDVVNAVNAAGKREARDIKVNIVDECRWSGLSNAETKIRVSEGMKSEVNKARVAKARLIASRKAVRDHFKNSPAVVHIVNREQIEFMVDAWGRDWPYKVVIIDESDSLKDHTTNRFKALKRVRPLIKRMHQLTATPAAESHLHLFAQIYLLDQGERFGKSITKFRGEYFDYNQYSRVYKLKPGAAEQIAEKISDICLTMKAEQYLPLEKPIMLTEKVKLLPAQRAMYESMQRDLIVQLPSGVEIEAETAAALSQKLLQMASGVLYETVLEPVGDTGDFKKRRIVHAIHDHKIEKLQTIVEESCGETILVAYWHESSRARLLAAFPKAVAMDKSGSCIKKWNEGKIQMLIVHLQSASYGLNLQHGGRRLVIFDLYWSLAMYQQLIGRLARQGQKRVVMVHHLIAEGTRDEDVAADLLAKRDAQENLFNLLRRIRQRQLAKTTESVEIACKVVESDLKLI